jgi:Zn-dependent membrane protease YugP
MPMNSWQVIHDAMAFFITPSAVLGLMLMILGMAVGDGGMLGLGVGFILAPLLVYLLAHIVLHVEGAARRRAIFIYFACVAGLAALAVLAGL